MTKPRPTNPKTPIELVAEWDSFASDRSRQLSTAIDISFEHILFPAINELLDDTDKSQLLDVGFGTGELTLKLSSVVDNTLVGIEPSMRSLELAQQLIDSDPTGDSGRSTVAADVADTVPSCAIASCS